MHRQPRVLHTAALRQAANTLLVYYMQEHDRIQCNMYAVYICLFILQLHPISAIDTLGYYYIECDVIQYNIMQYKRRMCMYTYI